MVGGDCASSHEKLFFTSTLMPGFSKKLELPSAFVRHIIPGKIAKIRDPLGFQWPINIQGDAPNFCFGDGWERFTKVYMLEVGYVLIFLYEGDMSFRVMIFGQNLYRKEYCLEFPDEEGKIIKGIPCQDAASNGNDSRHKNTELQMSNEIDGMEKIDVNDEPRSTLGVSDGTYRDETRKLEEDPEDISGRTTSNKRRMIEYSHEEVTKHKRVKIERINSLDKLNEIEVTQRVVEKKMTREDKTVSNVPVVESNRYEKAGEGEQNSQDLVLEEAESSEDVLSFTSIVHKNDYIRKEPICHKDVDNDGNIPPKFRITLKPNNLDGHFYLTIPVKFKMDAGLQKARKVILRDSDGDEWETEVLHSTKNRALLSRGWRDFCIHNKPRPGDDCEFQLCPEKKEDTKILQVCIFRKSEEERQAAIEVHRTCGVNISPEPSFWITITSYGLKFFSFPVPNPFVKATKMSKKKQVTLKDESGHLWTMGLVHTTRNRVLFANSDWKFFCSRNNIQSGDVLEFRSAYDSDENDTFQVKKLDGPPDSRR